jgi:fermentation-respiration switch protein FrsA (DUF1100 family)
LITLQQLKRLFVVLITLYLLALAVLYVFQRALVFAPNPDRTIPDQAGFQNITEITLTNSRAEKLYHWFAPGQRSSPVILVMHGNAGNVSSRYQKLTQLQAAGYGVFLVGYPGYGGSEGKPTEQGFVESAVLAYEYLSENGYAAADIVLYGESLGSAVAVQLASLKDARALILEAAMSSVREIAAEQYPFVPLDWLLLDPFLSIDHIRGVEEPLLMLHGDSDQSIPIESGQALFAAAREPKLFHVVAGGGHNDLYDHSIIPVITKFLSAIE